MVMAKSCVVYPPPPYATLKSPLHLQHYQSQHQNRNNLLQFKYPTLAFSSSFPRPHQNLFFLLNVSASASTQYKLFAFPRRRPNLAINALDSNGPNSHHKVPLARRFQYFFGTHCLNSEAPYHCFL